MPGLLDILALATNTSYLSRMEATTRIKTVFAWHYPSLAS